MPTYQPLGQSRDDMRHGLWRRVVPATNDAETRSQKGLNTGFAILDLAETLVKLPRLDSNQQPFG